MSKVEVATFGGGCFWCVEAVLRRLRGVLNVKPGYMGGSKPDPTYHEVCSGTTGHAEVVQVEFNPHEITYHDLLEVFFATHDPTQLNRQGNDVGTQYRSVVFYHNDEQREEALEMIIGIDSSKQYSRKVVTEVVPAAVFYEAEDYHHRYYEINRSQPYCSFIITPKIQKLEKNYKEKLA